MDKIVETIFLRIRFNPGTEQRIQLTHPEQDIWESISATYLLHLLIKTRKQVKMIVGYLRGEGIVIVVIPSHN